jgi:multiple sugar transport system permease protein
MWDMARLNAFRAPLLRDLAAMAVVGLWMFPIFWWFLSSVKPLSANTEIGNANFFDFVPTFENYALVLFRPDYGIMDVRPALLSSLIVAFTATAITLLAALPMAYVLSTVILPRKNWLLGAVLFQRATPPIAIIFPLVVGFHAVGLFDTYLGVALAHTTLNLPFAVLLLKSFFDDIPPEIADAAKIDGATRLQTLLHIHLPVVKGGIAATAIFSFTFSWTEFLLSLFLTTSIRMFPIQASLMTGAVWGPVAAMSVIAFVPSFLFILLVQRHIVRGLTLGMYK